MIARAIKPGNDGLAAGWYEHPVELRRPPASDVENPGAPVAKRRIGPGRRRSIYPRQVGARAAV